MQKFIIKGGKPLKGTIQAMGAKNAATPILAGTLLTKAPCIISNLPLIEDVFRMLELLKSMGAEIKWLGKRKIKICTKNVNPKNLNQKTVCSLRSSILLIGPMLARFKSFSINKPGGCNIGARPIDTHLHALESLGAKITKERPFLHITAKNLKAAKITMLEFSVTATENAVMAAVCAQGKTIIYNSACDHYVQDLCNFLNKIGAKIFGIGTHILKITGNKKLHGADYQIMPDPIEMGTFICLAAATHSNILIKNFKPDFLRAEILKFKQAGIKMQIKHNTCKVLGKNSKLKAVKVHNMPAPGFTADLLHPFAVLLTQAKGQSLVHDWMYEGRLKYINDLNKMGANALICDVHRALISGPSVLKGQEITSYDLRSGASLLIAGLCAKGRTVISDAYQVDRGYEKIEQRLQKLGADIARIS